MDAIYSLYTCTKFRKPFRLFYIYGFYRRLPRYLHILGHPRLLLPLGSLMRLAESEVLQNLESRFNIDPRTCTNLSAERPGLPGYLETRKYRVNNIIQYSY
jgi:hypothetical protein